MLAVLLPGKYIITGTGMPTPQEQAQIFNEAIAQGLTEDEALSAAGITDPDSFFIDQDGQLEPFSPTVDATPAAVDPALAVDTLAVPDAGSDLIENSNTDIFNSQDPFTNALDDQNIELVNTVDQDTEIFQNQDPFSDPFFTDNSNNRVFTEDIDTALSGVDDPLVDQQPERVENTAWFDQDVTTSQETVTGGSVRTTTVTPTISLDTPESQFYQAAADDVAAQKAARAAELRAQGLSGAAVLQDPQYRSLSQRQQELEYQSWQSKETVSGTPTVTTEPGSGEEFEQTVDINRLDSLTNDDPEAELAEISAQPDLINESNFNIEAVPVGGNYTEVYNPETGNYDVVDLDNGDIVAEGLSQQEAMIQAQDLSFGDPAYPQPQDELITEREINFGPDNGPLEEDDLATAALEDTIIRGNETDVRADVNTQDWRVRLSLAPGANYLYADPDLALGSIMSPLKNTNGVIFPYTPQIDITYQANYSSDALTHSNYYSYFYQSSYVQTVQVRGTFTAQDTQDANYLLAVIHFLRSATKMFYGQDTEAGTPPPLVFLSGLGSFQFNNHPCVISQFNYNLPSDVDYIPAGTTVANYEGGSNYGFANIGQISSGTGLLAGIANSLGGPLSRLLTLGADAIGNQVQRGADPVSRFTANTSQVADPTYVPTKMEISLVLLPVISRTRVSSVFSLKDYASGSLIKKGFW